MKRPQGLGQGGVIPRMMKGLFDWQTLPRMLACRLAQLLVVPQIRAGVGVRRAIVSGGGSLAPHLDDFFQVRSNSVAGLPLLPVKHRPCSSQTGN